MSHYLSYDPRASPTNPYLDVVDRAVRAETAFGQAEEDLLNIPHAISPQEPSRARVAGAEAGAQPRTCVQHRSKSLLKVIPVRAGQGTVPLGVHLLRR